MYLQKKMIISLHRAMVLLGCALTVAGCKSPRSTRQIAEGDLTGRWTAESVAVGAPHDSGTVQWRMIVEQQPAGRLTGRGTMHGANTTTEFTLRGLRDQSQIDLRFEMSGNRVMYHGGIGDVKTIVGEMYLERDTLPVTFTRE